MLTFAMETLLGTMSENYRDTMIMVDTSRYQHWIYFVDLFSFFPSYNAPWMLLSTVCKRILMASCGTKLQDVPFLLR